MLIGEDKLKKFSKLENQNLATIEKLIALKIIMLIKSL